ncbi:MAG: hypothetical protein U0234_10810 [Sandaracinus sp.]
MKLFASARPDALEALRALPGVSAFAWCFGTRDDVVTEEDGPLVGLVPTAHPVEALVLVGVAGPAHGIGSAALARFFTTLRSFASYRIEAMGEERIEASITPRDAAAALLIADRMRHVCPPLARAHAEPAPIAAELVAGRLVMDFR